MAHALDALKQLEANRTEFDDQAAQVKLRCLRSLKAGALKSSDQVMRLHEILCWMQTVPDSEDVLSHVEQILDRFHRRRDLKQHAEQLADTGIAGAAIHFRFYAATAIWLLARWPAQLYIDWDEFENINLFEPFLTLLATYSETPALDNISWEPSEWIDRLKGLQETDAAFVLKRLKQLAPNEFLHERLYEEFDVPLIVAPGQDSPSRTHAKYEKSPIVFQSAELDRSRPAVSDEIQRPPMPAETLSRAEGSQLIDLARSAMVTRLRDLDAFAYADANDVWLVNDGGGLQFVLYGMLPQRRFLLETQYGYLILRNGVPISYGTVTGLFNSAEVAYTIFDTFRGGDSARLYVRSLVMAHHVFGCDTFMVDPYQLGEDNEDALQSGAWWFYQKLGYRPRCKKLLRLMQQELSKMKQRPRHRSPRAVLKQLAIERVFLSLHAARDDVVGVLDLASVGLQITDLYARRFGSAREEGEAELAAEAAQRLGLQSFRGWSTGEKLAWRRWAPLVALLDVEPWQASDKHAFVQLIRNKGGRSELDYLRRFDDHQLLREAISRISCQTKLGSAE